MRHLGLCTAVLVFPLLAGGGCGVADQIQTSIQNKVTETAINAAIPDGQGDVQVDGNGYTYRDESGASFSVGENLKLPADFPTDVPVKEGANILSAAINPTDGSSTLVLTLPGTAEEVTIWYADAITNAGWTAEGSWNMGGSSGKTYTKGDMQLAYLAQPSTDGEENKVTVTLARTKK